MQVQVQLPGQQKTTVQRKRGGLTGLKIDGNIGDGDDKSLIRRKDSGCQSVACTHTETPPVLNLIFSIESQQAKVIFVFSGDVCSLKL